MKLTYIKSGWLVLVLALLFGAILAGVQIGLKPRIAENQRNETYSRIPQLVSGADASRTQESAINGLTVYKAFSSSGQHVGWVVRDKGNGYGGPVDVLVGTDPAAAKITGIWVLSQTETPGLGNRVTEEQFRNQFAGKTAEAPIEVIKSAASAGNEIQAITGATVSSRTVTDIVNDAVAKLRAHLASVPGYQLHAVTSATTVPQTKKS